MDYVVRTEVFEGPFDLLLHLIARQRVDLWQVSLSRITEDYLAEIRRMRELNLEVATEFLVVGATPEELARLAAAALTPAPPPEVTTTHIAPPRLSVAEAVASLAQRLQERGASTLE